jgi:putative DNA methylase
VTDRRFVEETFPVRAVSDESAKEKSIRHGHISTLHIWWARRPLASSRAINYASLIGATNDSESTRRTKDFIVRLSKWTNSLDESIMAEARKNILDANEGRAPKVLDPFAGGGAIPLEALRLGCETYINDYNPVAVLILKCTLEYPQKFAGLSSKGRYELTSDETHLKLLNDVRRWEGFVLNEITKELGTYYPEDANAAIPIGYVWSKVIHCQNPSCGAEIPLVRQFWLAISDNKKVALFPFVSNRQLKFRIVGTGYDKMPKDFDPSAGTVRGAVATCFVCGSVTDDTNVRKLFSEKKATQRMIAVITDTSSGRSYRVATEQDDYVFKRAEEYFEKKRKTLQHQWGIDPVPDEPIPTPDGREYQTGNLLYHFASVVLYGLTRWGDLFNARQKLTLITLTEKVRNAHKLMLNEGYDAEYARAVVSYLAIAVDRLADYSTTLCVLNPTGGRGIKNTFSRQALPMVWDYTESNPFNPSGAGWATASEKNEKWIKHASTIRNQPRAITQSSATVLHYPNDFFDAILTDPPYYDNVPYSVLSDFFYVWLKRSVGDLYPELFSTPLAPKSQEAIANLPLLRGMNKIEAAKMVKGIKTGEIFENMLSESFREFHRVLKDNGIAVIVYAHKSTAGWEKLINSLLDSGLVVTGAWPIHTEKKGRLNSQETASLASSIYVVARKLKRQPTGFYQQVKDELKNHLGAKLTHLWEEGISGPDFFISAIGSSIEVFGKYDRIIDDEGNVIRADRMLDDVRKTVTDYAVRQVLHNGFAGEISELTRFYVLWRWAYADTKVEFDEARKLAQSVGLDLTNEWNKGFIHKDKEFVSVLGPEDRSPQTLDKSVEAIDVLHNVLLLWKKGKSEEIVKVLKETGFGDSDVFYRVAQAISESLPNESKEKRLLEGFLSGRERISHEVRVQTAQTRLFEK